MVPVSSIYRPYYPLITLVASLLVGLNGLLARILWSHSAVLGICFVLLGLVALFAMTVCGLAILLDGVSTVGQPWSLLERFVICTISIAIAYLGVAVSLPNFVRSGPGPTAACSAHLRQLDGAAQQYALDNHLPKDALVTMDQIKAYLKDGKVPECPMGGRYHVGRLTNSPTCTIPGHNRD